MIGILRVQEKNCLARRGVSELVFSNKINHLPDHLKVVPESTGITILRPVSNQPLLRVNMVSGIWGELRRFERMRSEEWPKTRHYVNHSISLESS